MVARELGGRHLVRLQEVCNDDSFYVTRATQEAAAATLLIQQSTDIVVDATIIVFASHLKWTTATRIKPECSFRSVAVGPPLQRCFRVYAKTTIARTDRADSKL